MLNKVHGKVNSKRFMKMAVIMLIFVLVSGYVLPEYTAFAENAKAQEENVGGLSASEQVEDEESGSRTEKKTQKNLSAADQVEDEINENAEKKDEENGESLSAADQVVDGEEEEQFAKDGKFEAEIKGYRVAVNVPEGAFNKEVKLQIKEAVANKDDAINDEENVIELTEEQKKELFDRQMLYANHLDISFVDKGGDQVEPSKKVKVSMSIAKELITDGKDFEENGSGVLHLSEKKNGEIKSADLIIDPAEESTKAVSYDEDNEEVTVKFAADDFSVYTYAHDWYNIDVKFYYVDKGNMNRVITAENPGFGKDYNNSIFWSMPEWNTTPGNNDVRAMKKVDYTAGTYTVTPYAVGKDVTYDIMIPFGYTYENTYAISTSSRSQNMSQRVNGGQANVKQAMRAKKDNPNVNNGEENQYWAYVVNNQTIHSNNPANKIDFAAVYSRLSTNQLPIYAVPEGSRTPLASTLGGFLNDSTFTNNFAVNGNSTPTSETLKYNMTFTNNKFTAFNKDLTTVREKDESKFVFKSAYIIRDDGSKDGQKIEIKGLRYDGSKNLWFYSTDGKMGNTSSLQVMTCKDKVYIEFEEVIKEAQSHKLYFRNGDGARNANGDYPAIKGSDGKDYFDLDSVDNYKIDFTKDEVTYNGQTKSLKETFNINTDKELYKGFIRHATSGNIDGNKSNEIEYIQRTNGQLKIKMKGKDLTTLSNKTVYAIFMNEPDLRELNTIDNNALGFHVHMFNYPKSPMLFARSDNSWSAEYRRGITRAGSTREGETEQGLYGKTTTGGAKYSERFPNIEKVFVWRNGATFLDPNDVTNLSGIFSPASSNSNYVGEANHLFLSKIYNETGYMYYNSEENAAVLNPKGSNGLMDFSVYNAIVSPVQFANGSFQYGPDSFFYHRGNFLPFNDIDLNKRYAKNLYDANGYTWNDQEDDDFNQEAVAKDPATTVYGIKNGRVRSQGTPDYFHGMYAYMNFLQPVGGIVRQLPDGTNLSSPEPMVYEFTGDDDMMVYIDGVLVLDLGGVHDAQSGKIDFSTGEVTYSFNGSYTPSGTVDRSPIIDDDYKTTIKAQFQNAGKSGVSWRGNTFADATYHTIQIFYMERGEGASNLKIKVNIPPVPDAFFTVEKKVNEVEGVTKDPNEEFSMKIEYQNSNGQWRPINELNGVQRLIENADGTFSTENMSVSKYYLDDDPNTLLDIGANGIIKLKDGQRACIPGIINNNLKVRVTEVASNKHSNLTEYYDIDYSLTSNGQIISNNNNQISVEVPATRTLGVVVGNTPDVPDTGLKIKKVVEKDVLGNIDTNTAFRIWVEVEQFKDGKERLLPGVLTRANGTTENVTVKFEDGKSNGTHNGRAKFDLKHNEMIEIKNLPVGATYHVEENLEYCLQGNSRVNVTGTYNTPAYTNQDGTLTTTIPTAEVKNSPKTTELSVSKIVQPDTYGIVNANKQFKIIVQVQGLNNKSCYAERVKNGAVTESGQVPFNNNGQTTLYIKHDESIKIKDLPIGATYTVLEQFEGNDGQLYELPVYTNQTGILPAGGTTATVTNKPVKIEHLLYKGNLNTMPKETNGKYKQSITQTEFDNIEKLAGAKFRVIEAKAYESTGSGFIYKQLEKVQSNGKDLILTSEAPDGRIVLPSSLNPNPDEGLGFADPKRSGHYVRYFLLEEVEAPVGYKKSDKLYGVEISTQLGATVPGEQTMYYVNGLYEVARPASFNSGSMQGITLECGDLGDGYISYNVIPNSPVEITKVSSQENDKKLAGAKFVVGDVGTRSNDYYGTLPGLVPNSSNPIVLESDSQGKINLTDVLKALGRNSNGVYNKGVDLGNGKKGYLLYEIKAPQGYEIAKAPWLLIVDGDGNVGLEKYNGTNANYAARINAGTLIPTESNPSVAHWDFNWPKSNFGNRTSDGKIDNTKKPIKLYKVSSEDDKPLGGAKFVMADVWHQNSNPNSSNYQTYTNNLLKKNGSVKVFESEPDGTLDISEALDLISGKVGTYVNNGCITLLLFEIDAPTGYKLICKPWLVTIDADSNVTIKRSSEANATFEALVKGTRSDGVTLTNGKANVGLTWSKNSFGNNIEGNKVDNEPFFIEKVDRDTTSIKLDGAVFEVFKANYSESTKKYYKGAEIEGNDTVEGESKKKYVSKNGGKIDISNLFKYNTQYNEEYFLLYEKTAPVGYNEPPKTPWLIIVDYRNETFRIYQSHSNNVDYGDDGIPYNIYSLCDGVAQIKNGKDNDDLFKVDKNDLNKPLGGVRFEAYEASWLDGDGEIERDSNGYLILHKKSNTPISGVKPTANNGQLTIPYTSSGYVLLFETTAKEGYMRQTEPWIIRYENGKIIKVYTPNEPYKHTGTAGKYNTGLYTDTKPANGNKITNDKLYELPKAGGIGTHPFAFIGTMMMVIAAVMIFARKEEA